MSLTNTDIERIANLARLELAPEEQARMLSKINDFFGIVEQIRTIDTAGVVPMAHPIDAMPGALMELRLRPDLASEPNGTVQRDLNQRSAPAVERGLFLVPKVIE